MNEQMLHEAFLLFSEKAMQMEESYKALQKEILLLRKKLKNSDWTLKTILSQLSEGLIFLSNEGKILLYNDSAASLINFCKMEMQNQLFWDFYEDHFFGFSLKEALSHQKNQKSVVVLKNESEVREVEISFSNAVPHGSIILMRDLTDIKKLERIVQRNERLRELGEMAAALAHEIRNPLSGIEGFASLLAQDLKKMPPQYKMAQPIIEGSRVLNQLVSQILDYCRPLQLNLVFCPLEEVVEESVLFSQLAHPQASIHWKVIKNIYVLIDKGHFKRALLNLVLNAVQASPGSLPVEIYCYEDLGAAYLEIKDQGSGIASENIEKIFIPFFSNKPSGTGLGLSEAQKIIHAHGGNITVRSVPTQGSTFTIRLVKKEKESIPCR